MEKSIREEEQLIISSPQKRRKERERMSVVWAIAFVWLVGLGCIPIMKKIQPDSYKAYAIYVLAVCVAFTCFVGWYIS